MPKRIRRGAIFARAIHKSFRDFARLKKSSGQSPTLKERAHWLTHACRGVLASLDVRVSAEGAMPEDGLIVSNHLSYLDILCYSSIAPCIFVSKAEVRGWPVFGRLATNGGTIYIDRTSKADAHRVASEIEAALRARISWSARPPTSGCVSTRSSTSRSSVSPEWRTCPDASGAPDTG